MRNIQSFFPGEKNLLSKNGVYQPQIEIEEGMEIFSPHSELINFVAQKIMQWQSIDENIALQEAERKMWFFAGACDALFWANKASEHDYAIIHAESFLFDKIFCQEILQQGRNQYSTFQMFGRNRAWHTLDLQQSKADTKMVCYAIKEGIQEYLGAC